MRSVQIQSLSATLLLGACSSLPPNVVLSEPSPESHVATFAKCAVSQNFTGTPRALREDELQRVSTTFGQYAKWDITGLTYQKYRLVEVFLCACRDYPFADAELKEMADATRDAKISRETKRIAVDAIGAGFEFTTVASTPEATDVQRIISPRRAPSCLVMQAIRAPATEISMNKFFGQLAVAESGVSGGLKEPGAKDRLRRLDELRKEGLINESEYKQRRKIIIDQL